VRFAWLRALQKTQQPRRLAPSPEGRSAPSTASCLCSDHTHPVPPLPTPRRDVMAGMLQGMLTHKKPRPGSLDDAETAKRSRYRRSRVSGAPGRSPALPMHTRWCHDRCPNFCAGADSPRPAAQSAAVHSPASGSLAVRPSRPSIAGAPINAGALRRRADIHLWLLGAASAPAGQVMTCLALQKTGRALRSA